MSSHELLPDTKKSVGRLLAGFGVENQEALPVW